MSSPSFLVARPRRSTPPPTTPLAVVVDSEPQVRRRLARAVHGEGYAVLSANDIADAGRAVSELLEHERDLEAVVAGDDSSEGGLALLARLRGAGFRGAFVLVCRERERSTIRRARRLGADAVFDRNVDDEDLRTVLRLLRSARASI